MSNTIFGINRDAAAQIYKDAFNRDMPGLLGIQAYPGCQSDSIALAEAIKEKGELTESFKNRPSLLGKSPYAGHVSDAIALNKSIIQELNNSL